MLHVYVTITNQNHLVAEILMSTLNISFGIKGQKISQIVIRCSFISRALFIIFCPESGLIRQSFICLQGINSLILTKNGCYGHSFEWTHQRDLNEYP